MYKNGVFLLFFFFVTIAADLIRGDDSSDQKALPPSEMKLSLLTTAQALLLSASAHPQYGTGSHLSWHPPGPNDFRGPCPMMNTLANHGFLPHDGRNITKENAIRGIGAGLNFDADLASLMWEQAIIANPEPNATFFTLDHLNRHNVLEHDASLSRTDAFFGNNHIFNQSVFDTTKSYWTAPLLTAQMLANSKLARQIESRAFNPNYTFSKTTEEFSLGEVAAPVIAFGDMQKGTVDRALVEYFFENERLPEVLGWSKKNQTIGLQDILNVVTIIRNATSLFTGAPGSDDSPHGNNRRDLHAAFLS